MSSEKRQKKFCKNVSLKQLPITVQIGGNIVFHQTSLFNILYNIVPEYWGNVFPALGSSSSSSDVYKAINISIMASGPHQTRAVSGFEWPWEHNNCPGHFLHICKGIVFTRSYFFFYLLCLLFIFLNVFVLFITFKVYCSL